jgi:hypothetical protein
VETNKLANYSCRYVREADGEDDDRRLYKIEIRRKGIEDSILGFKAWIVDYLSFVK